MEEFLRALAEVLKIALPLALAIWLVQVVLRQQLRREELKERYRIRMEAFSKLLPLRIGAYERAMLYADRIHPANLIKRSDPARKTAKMLEQMLLMEVEVEYEHNVVQQLYVSETAWRTLLMAKAEVVKLVQEAAASLGPGATGLDLTEKIVQLAQERNSETVAQAQIALKRDLSNLSE